MSFFRHREIYRSDVFQWPGNGARAVPGLIVCDEFPAGYSSADCSPAGSASASPAVHHFALKWSCRSITFHRTVNSVLTVCLSPGGHPTRRYRFLPCGKTTSGSTIPIWIIDAAICRYFVFVLSAGVNSSLSAEMSVIFTFRRLDRNATLVGSGMINSASGLLGPPGALAWKAKIRLGAMS